MSKKHLTSLRIPGDLLGKAKRLAELASKTNATDVAQPSRSTIIVQAVRAGLPIIEDRIKQQIINNGVKNG